MKLVFSSIKNNDIFEEDFINLPEQKGTIEFKHLQGAGGIAVVYAPNGTGKSSFANLLKTEDASDNISFSAIDDNGNNVTPETGSFHVIPDQISRNIIRGETTDYLVGAQIRREYELKSRIEEAFQNAFSQLISKYKSEYKVSKVGDYLVKQIGTVDDDIHRDAFEYISKLVNIRNKGKDIDRNNFVSFVRNVAGQPPIVQLEGEKREYVISNLAKSHIVLEILSIEPNEIVVDQNVLLVECHDDAIRILKKYPDMNLCVVCDHDIPDAEGLLNSKTDNRRQIYEGLTDKTKNILDKIVRDESLMQSDPFEIKRTVSAFISNGEILDFISLQEELRTYIRNIGNEMIACLYHCFDGSTLYSDFDEHAQLTATQPRLDSEELLYIEQVISENIGKDITIVRDEGNDNNYKLKIGDKDLLGTGRQEMELSSGEQNFISLAFELIYARHSNKEYVVMDDPISSFDSVYKNKIAFCIIKFLEDKKQIVLTHNLDLVRLLEVQLDNCFNLYILNNISDGENGFIPVSVKEKKLLINLHALIKLFQNKDNELVDIIHNRKQFMIAMIPFMRGYSHISLDSNDYYGRLSGIMHGYTANSLDVIPIYNELFGEVFTGEEIISVSDVLGIDCDNLDIIDNSSYPLLADTLEQTLIYYHLRMKVEKELVDIFNLNTDNNPMLSQVIQRAFYRAQRDPDYEQMRAYRVFFASRKTLLNEFNHFEGNMNIFQPAIDISDTALRKEVAAIELKLSELRTI